MEDRLQVDINSGHFCQICERGFVSGRALGGHMRVHGAAAASEFNSGPSVHKRCGLRPNPKRSRRFAEGEYDILDHSGSRSSAEPLEQCPNNKGKGKRSKRLRYAVEADPQRESQCDVETDTAYCLVMLSSAGDFWGSGDYQRLSATSPPPQRQIPIESGLEKIRKSRNRAKSTDSETDPSQSLRSDEPKKTVYECKGCNKRFDSFQALGGHRASHNKLLKGCSSRKASAILNQNLELESSGHQNASAAENGLWNDFSEDRIREAYYSEETDESPFSSKKAGKAHKCSICYRIFSSGQALGGHKRCHWLSPGTSDTTTTNSTISTSKESAPRQQRQPPGGQLPDLNLPAPLDDDDSCTHLQH